MGFFCRFLTKLFDLAEEGKISKGTIRGTFGNWVAKIFHVFGFKSQKNESIGLVREISAVDQCGCSLCVDLGKFLKNAVSERTNFEDNDNRRQHYYEKLRDSSIHVPYYSYRGLSFEVRKEEDPVQKEWNSRAERALAILRQEIGKDSLRQYPGTRYQEVLELRFLKSEEGI